MKKRVGDFPFSSPPACQSPALFGGLFFWAEEENDLQAFWERLRGCMDIFPSHGTIALERPFTWLVGAWEESVVESIVRRHRAEA